ncbi:MAG: carbohydrate kinase family protein [Pseudomonadota bacterium]
MTPDTRAGLICLGNLTIDDVVLPNGTERPGSIGGDALYAVLAARPWQSNAEMVAPVGTDLPDSVRAGIRAAGLSEEGLPARDRPTIHNRVVYDKQGGREWTLYNDPSDFDVLSPLPGDIPDGYRRADRILVSAMALTATETLIPFLKDKTAARVAFDPQEDYIVGNEALLTSLVASVDVFMPSEEEVTRLTGLTDWPKAARLFSDWGPSVVVIKRGADGTLVYDRERNLEFHLPAYPGASVVDTTGAGDSFCGAFMAALGTYPPETAAIAGAAAASFTVSGYGAAPLFETPATAIRARFDAWVDRTIFKADADGRMVLTEGQP